MLEKKKRIYAKDYIGWWGYAILQYLFCSMPLKLAYFLAAVLGDCLFFFSGKNRRIIEGNLRAALGLKGRILRKHTREIFRNFSRNLIEFLSFRKFDEKWFKKHVEVSGLDNMKKALSFGRGVIAITFHIGNLELHAYMTRCAGFPTNAIWASHKNPKIEEFFIRPRIEKGLKVITTAGGGAIKKALDALNANELVYFVIDHSYNKKGVTVNFLGHQALIPSGAAIVALKTNAPIVPAVAVRTGYRRFKIIYGRPVEYTLTGDAKRDTQDILQRCIKAMEGFVREYPDQWGLFRKYRSN